MTTLSPSRAGDGTALTRGFPVAGATAGAVSAFVFLVVHDIFISDIWFSLVLMLVAGALCGLCVSWSYGRLFPVPSMRSWWGYNLTYVAMFVVLGLASVLVFEPTTTMAALTAANEPPHELIGAAMPLTVVFTVVFAAAITWHMGRTWQQFGAVLLTTSVLVILLGLNVSVIGLVEIPRGSLYLVAEMFGLIVLLNLVFAAVFGVMLGARLRRAQTGVRDARSDQAP